MVPGAANPNRGGGSVDRLTRMELDQLEALALAADPDAREAALARLLPGTEDDFFYRCLARLHRIERGAAPDQAELDAIEALIQTWVQRYGETSRVQQIRDRRALLVWDRDPVGSREHLTAEQCSLDSGANGT